jgi:hypothetical protein
VKQEDRDTVAWACDVDREAKAADKDGLGIDHG